MAPKKTRLILIRHGITDWNIQKRYQGQTDIPLNEQGKEQARQAAAELASTPIDTFYASDLKRALETAQIIAKDRNLEIKTNPKLRETHFGVWEGLTIADIKVKYPDLLEKANSDPFNTIFPTGESRGQMFARVGNELKEIAKAHPGETVAIASHEGSISAGICGLLNQSFIEMRPKYRLDNAAFHILEQDYDGTWKIVSMGRRSPQAQDK
jgi:broad specificity phosphatase PhoE